MNRKAPATRLNSWEWDRKHQAKRIAKLEKIQTLRALLEMHEENPDHDHEYVLALKARLRSAENQFNAMKI